MRVSRASSYLDKEWVLLRSWYWNCTVGFKVLSCELGGQWSGKAPSCKFVDCGAPPNIDNGRYILTNGTTTVESLVEYQCGDDYWLDGQKTQTCTREGKWSADAPSCECKYLIVVPFRTMFSFQWLHARNLKFHQEATSSGTTLTFIRRLSTTVKLDTC